MMKHRTVVFGTACVALVAGIALVNAQRGGAANDIAVSGELRQWHKVTLTLTGPQADETASAPNPFLDYRLSVIFTHESGTPSYPYRRPTTFEVPQ